MEALDPYKAPPKYLKDTFKEFHSLKKFEENPNIIDFSHPQSDKGCTELPADHYDLVFKNFLQLPSLPEEVLKKYDITDIPGTKIPLLYCHQNLFVQIQ
jgi:hypothetical protein